MVSVLFEGVGNVLTVVVEGKIVLGLRVQEATVGQAVKAQLVGIFAGEQCRPARRTGRGGAEGLSEYYGFLCKLL